MVLAARHWRGAADDERALAAAWRAAGAAGTALAYAQLRLAVAPNLVRAQVLARLCWALKREDRYAESERMAMDLRALAERLGDEEHRVEADMVLASLGALRAIPAGREGLARARQLGLGRRSRRRSPGTWPSPFAWRGRRNGLPSAPSR